MFTQDTIPRTLKGCEATFIAQKYRDNFGPALLDSFTARPVLGPLVTCAWTARVEQGCRSYRLHRVCSDGTSMLVADSLSCLGAGVPYVVVDDPAPCSGKIKYVLSLVDSLAPGLWEENVVAEAALVIGGAPAPASISAARRALAAGSEDGGFSTPQEAVQALGYAVTEHNPTHARRSMADGFSYYTADGLFWGNTIERILEGGRVACLVASDSTLDSLVFVPQATRYLANNLAEVTVSVRFVYKCSPIEADWIGQIEALVERRSIEDGWRIRQMSEVR